MSDDALRKECEQWLDSFSDVAYVHNEVLDSLIRLAKHQQAVGVRMATKMCHGYASDSYSLTYALKQCEAKAKELER